MGRSSCAGIVSTDLPVDRPHRRTVRPATPTSEACSKKLFISAFLLLSKTRCLRVLWLRRLGVFWRSMLFLTESEVRQLLPMNRALGLMRTAFERLASARL